MRPPDRAEPRGLVTDFKRFAVHDGDGIRTTVFLKGCPLKCVWCHNPEGISPKPQLSFYPEKCVKCGECARVCPSGAQKIDGSLRRTLDRSKCLLCGGCESACPVGALRLNGRLMGVAEVIKIVAEDKIFYNNGGGMTLSGGEPTMQPEFALALLTAAKADGINTALDTCGFAEREIYARLLPAVDTFLYDVKHITREGHIRCTGRPNEKIIENLRFLSDSGAKIEVRIPLVPGYNDDAQTLNGIGRMLSSVNIAKARLLPYHAFARSKYEALGMADTLPDAAMPTGAELEAAARLLRGYGIAVVTE